MTGPTTKAAQAAPAGAEAQAHIVIYGGRRHQALLWGAPRLTLADTYEAYDINEIVPLAPIASTILTEAVASSEVGPMELVRNAAVALEAEVDAGWSPDARAALHRLRAGVNMLAADGVLQIDGPGVNEAPRG